MNTPSFFQWRSQQRRTISRWPSWPWVNGGATVFHYIFGCQVCNLCKRSIWQNLAPRQGAYSGLSRRADIHRWAARSAACFGAVLEAHFARLNVSFSSSFNARSMYGRMLIDSYCVGHVAWTVCTCRYNILFCMWVLISMWSRIFEWKFWPPGQNFHSNIFVLLVIVWGAAWFAEIFIIGSSRPLWHGCGLQGRWPEPFWQSTGRTFGESWSLHKKHKP